MHAIKQQIKISLKRLLLSSTLKCYASTHTSHEVAIHWGFAEPQVKLSRRREGKVPLRNLGKSLTRILGPLWSCREIYEINLLAACRREPEEEFTANAGALLPFLASFKGLLSLNITRKLNPA